MNIKSITLLIMTGLSVVVSLFVFLYVRWGYQNTPLLNIDEAHFAACAARIIDNNEMPLIGCRDNKPPGIFWFYELCFRVFGIFELSWVRWSQAFLCLILLCQIMYKLVIPAWKRVSSAMDGKLKSIHGAWIPAIHAGMTSLENIEM